MHHNSLAMAALAALLAMPAGLAAQAEADRDIGWLDLLGPDRLVTAVVQSGVIAMRSLSEVRYDTLSTDLAGGALSITGFSLSLLDPDRQDCVVRADRVMFSGIRPLNIADIAVRIEVAGAEMAIACLDPAVRLALGPLGLDRLLIDQAMIAVDYQLASGAAQIDVVLGSPGLASVEATARLGYLAFVSDRWGDPVPVAHLTGAEVTLTDDGALTLLRGFLPPEFSDPDGAAALIRAEAENMLRRRNAAAERRQARDRGEDVSKAPGELAVTPAQQALLDSITAQVPRFLRDGGQVTLALSTPVGSRDERLDVERLYSDPRLAFDLLNPVLRALPPAREAMLPVALLVAAIEAPESLSDADRVLVGRALLSGHGAPLNIALARDLLVPVALAGDGGVAADLAGAFAEMDPAEAYGFALRAAGQGMPGALATLDRIEAVLDLATILSAQRDVAGEDLPDAPYASVSAMRATALARALGTAVSRDYGQAWYWASLAAAAGDRTAAALRDEIAARMASHDTQGPAVWAAATAELTARMTEEWLARDLPAQFRQE